ncbi:MAG: hypothetical protein C5B51_00355 [Terriglobia bacterium]|nr:MAG: hypothetical protein C5B51_00355 [Terriglobia bacterium]
MKYEYLYAHNTSGQDNQWQTYGPWTVPGPPAVVSINTWNNNSWGSSDQFIVTVSDLGGTASIGTVLFLMNTGINGVNGCWLMLNYTGNTSTSTLQLANDAATGFSAPVLLSSSSPLSNSQCTVWPNSVAVSTGGNNMTVTFPLTFTKAFFGYRYAYAQVNDTGNQTSGWVNGGGWPGGPAYAVTQGPPYATSALPQSGTGASATFNIVVGDPNGAGAIYTVAFLLNSGIAGANACWVVYYRDTNTLTLANDAATGFSAPVAVGSAATFSNSQCTLDVAHATAAPSGDVLVINLPLSFTAGFFGARNQYIYVTDVVNQNSSWWTMGTWNVDVVAPTVTSVTPNSGGGTSQTFALAVNDVSGPAAIGSISLLVNAGLNGVNACWVLYTYSTTPNTLQLANDAATGFSSPINVGSGLTLSNSQCTVSGTGASASVAGNSVTANVPISFSPSFAGAKNVYGLATDVFAQNSGWCTEGSWTIPATGFAVSVVPSAQGSSAVLAGLAATYTVTVTSLNSFNGTVTFSPSGVGGLPVGTSASFNPQSVTPPANGMASTTMTIGTTSTESGGITGNYGITVTGTSGSLAHSGAGSLAIQDFVLQFSPVSASVVRPTQGSSTVSFTIAATGVNGFSGTIGLNFQVLGGRPYACNPCDISSPGGSITPGGTTTLSVTLYPGGRGDDTVTGFRLTGMVAATSHMKEAGLTVTSHPDFSISALPGVQTITLPATTSPPYTLTTAASGGFNGAVSFSVASSPSGVTASFSPPTVSGSGQNSMTLHAPAGMAATYTVTITATSGSLSHQAVAIFGVQAATAGLPYPTQSAILSMFVERHQWLVNSGAGSGLYNLPDNDLSSVSSMVSSTKQQLDQLQSQAGSYTGPDYANARNNILQGFKSQLQTGLSSPSSWPTLDNYMNSVMLPSISTTTLSGTGSNDCAPGANCCPSGYTCLHTWAEVNFYSGGLGGRVDSWVEGDDAISYCSTVSGVKGTYISPNGTSTDIPIPGGTTNTGCGAGRAFLGYTTKDPRAGTYKIETFHSFTGHGNGYPPFGGPGFSPPASPPLPATRVFNQNNGYDVYQSPVSLAVQVAGAQMDPTGQIATVSNCSSPIVVTAVFTPPLPDYNLNKPPTVTWTGGSAGQDNFHRTAPCTVGTTTTITAAVGSYLLAQVQVKAVYTVSGQVTASGSNNPLPGVSITLQDPSNNPVGVQVTGSDGRYSFSVNAGGQYTLTPGLLNYAFSPQNELFDISTIHTVDFAGTPVKTVFLIHGIGQGPGDMLDLAGNLQSPLPLGIDPVRFRVDSGFSFASCAAVGNINCPGTCTISDGAVSLASYIQSKTPPGDIILIGFSMGGLLARDLILNKYGNVLAGRAVTLITLGTPSLGYPHATLDDIVFCPYLVDTMNGNWRILKPNNWPTLSDYLWSSTQNWPSASFPGTNGFWIAAYGQSCPNPIRNGDASTGCRDSSPRSDGVVCADSASYNIVTPPSIGPSATWFDPNWLYIHSNAGLGVATSFVLCAGGSSPYLLSDPPVTDGLFQTIVQVINGR